MSKDYESLLEYKKSTKDWHYNPNIPSIDYEYVGQIIDFDWSKIKDKLPPKEPTKTSASHIWPEDIKNGTLIPSQLSPDNLAAGKLDIKRWGYHEGNTIHTQYTDSMDELPEEVFKIKDLFNLDYSMVAIMKQEPGNFNAWHFDTYHTVTKRGNLSNEDKTKVKRYLICLEDWHWGHFIQIGNSVLAHWKAGQIFSWPYGMYHLTVNAGIKTRWACQVTGYPNKKSINNTTEFEFKISK